MNQNDDNATVIEKVIDGKLLLFKTDSVYDSEQVENKDTNTHQNKILDIGAKSPYLARVILQFEPMIKSAIIDENTQNRLIKHIWEMNKELVTCSTIFKSLKQEVNTLALTCNDIILQNKGSVAIPTLPQVVDLENRVNTFFIAGNKFLIETFKIFVILFDMAVAKNKEDSFKDHSRWIGSHFGTTHNLAQIVEQDMSWITLLSEASNAIEHPSKKDKIEIKNFSLIQGNKFIFPAWSYSLSHKKLGEVRNLNLLNDLDIFLDNMLCFFEEVMLQCVQEKLNESGNTLLHLEKFKEEKIDDNCPTQYGITYKV
jgi:hypothetical protein